MLYWILCLRWLIDARAGLSRQLNCSLNANPSTSWSTVKQTLHRRTEPLSYLFPKQICAFLHPKRQSFVWIGEQIGIAQETSSSSSRRPLEMSWHDARFIEPVSESIIATLRSMVNKLVLRILGLLLLDALLEPLRPLPWRGRGKFASALFQGQEQSIYMGKSLYWPRLCSQYPFQQHTRFSYLLVVRSFSVQSKSLEFSDQSLKHIYCRLKFDLFLVLKIQKICKYGEKNHATCHEGTGIYITALGILYRETSRR